MYDFYKYYILIGFHRYTHKVEVSREVYERYKEGGFSLSNYRITIPTKIGMIALRTEGVNFIEALKEVTNNCSEY